MNIDITKDALVSLLSRPIALIYCSLCKRCTDYSVLPTIAGLLVVVLPADVSADVFTNVAEATNDGYELVYTLPIGDTNAFLTAGDIPYSVDNSASITQPFDRIAYYLELDDGNGLVYAYASMDAFTSSVADISLPADGQVYQQYVDNMNVFSNSPNVTSGVGIATGNIEFWEYNYTGDNTLGVPGASGSGFGGYDTGDSPLINSGNYASFQVHNHGVDPGETIIAFNQWAGFNGNPSDLGIGNNPSGELDYTFSGNADTYEIKNLQVLVRPSTFSVDSSLSRAIYQRDENNRADIPLEGLVDSSSEAVLIEARAVPRSGYAGLPTGWETIDSNPQSGAWTGSLDVSAGWYDIEIRSVDGSGNVIDNSTVERVGVGEVFVIAGQSNSANYSDTLLSAEDDRVSAYDTNTWQHADDPMPIADGTGGSPWPALGDMLVDELDVPVGFISVGWGGTSAEQWEPGASGPDTEPLYNRLQDALTALGPDGARAVLWHQGEADNFFSTSAEDYEESLETIIAQSRLDAGYDLLWGIAQASYLSVSDTNDPNITGAQLKVAEEDLLNFVGAYTDDLGLEWRWDGIHFNEAGLIEHASRWFDQILSQVIASPIGGDYNGDGVVDAADYTIWRDLEGESITLPNEKPDAATPGLVDQEDFDYWVTQYGTTSSLTASAVPEPKMMAILVAGLVATGVSGIRRR